MIRPGGGTCPARRSAGFTLIEVMIALVILATGMLALALCVPVASRRIMKSGTQTREVLRVRQQTLEWREAPRMKSTHRHAHCAKYIQAGTYPNQGQT